MGNVASIGWGATRAADPLQTVLEIMARTENRQINLDICLINKRAVEAMERDPAVTLQPLVDVRTGQPIANFPATWGDSKNLDDGTMDAILEALQIQVAATTPWYQKRDIIWHMWTNIDLEFQ